MGKIDFWSLGCILAELWTGYVLFQNDSVQSLLARILGIVGEFPYHLMTRGRYVPQYFTQDGQLYQEIDGPSCPDRGRRLHLLVPKKHLCSSGCARVPKSSWTSSASCSSWT